MAKRLLLGLLVLFASACASQPYALISTAVHPGSYPRPMANADVPREATVLTAGAAGEACSHNILGLVAWGNAGIAAATRDALAKASSAAGNATMLADMKVDYRYMSIAGLYGDFCTQVRGVALK